MVILHFSNFPLWFSWRPIVKCAFYIFDQHHSLLERKEFLSLVALHFTFVDLRSWGQKCEWSVLWVGSLSVDAAPLWTLG